MLENEILKKNYLLSIVKCAIQSMRHSNLNSKIQAIAINVFDQM